MRMRSPSYRVRVCVRVCVCVYVRVCARARARAVKHVGFIIHWQRMHSDMLSLQKGL